MTANWDEEADPLRQPPEADALEQQQDETEVGPPDTVEDAVPEASEADFAEQGVLVPDDQREMPRSLPPDANQVDALEQHQEVPVPEEDRRDLIGQDQGVRQGSLRRREYQGCAGAFVEVVVPATAGPRGLKVRGRDGVAFPLVVVDPP
ncbi:hypothetical protein [Micromonospora globbae]|uniref:hypothetical protein n=1 Tax=Micromonospora globbae TaxID=1894969 RepID=UPI0034303C67